MNSLCAALVGCAALAMSTGAEAQEIQLTGPLAGAPAVRKLRLHRGGHVDVALGSTFTLLDEYQRTILPGLRVTYHPTDWLGFGIWGGYGFQVAAGLSNELQAKAIDQRNCAGAPDKTECKLTAVNLTRGNLIEDQLAKFQWIAAPQVTFVPFRGKLALFAAAFIDTDIHFFLGGAVVGLQERKPCGRSEDGASLGITCSDQGSFVLQPRVAFAPTAGVGWTFYPQTLPISFGAEYRAVPFAWNTSGFDNAGAGNNEAFPDLSVNGKDRQFKVNSMITVNISVQLPLQIKTTD